MDWQHDRSRRTPTLQVQSPEFKPQSHIKRKNLRQKPERQLWGLNMQSTKQQEIGGGQGGSKE
jgi:hypothetical protein